jgi:glycolate oxidase iron-sulfur subunit
MFEFFDDGSGTDAAYGQDGLYIPEAADCMRCGLCVSHCPTFRINPIDEETPRRRIRTIDRVLNQSIVPSGKELAHLNNCLQCRACETVCPSKMAYGQLLDQARQKLAGMAKPSRLAGLVERLLLALIEHKSRLRFLSRLLGVYQRSGMQALLRQSGLLSVLKLESHEALLPPAIDASPLEPFYLATDDKRGSVALFTGCIAESLDRATALAAIRVLNRIGFDVIVPGQQGCCGALHQHRGHAEAASRLAWRNVGVFNALDVDAVVYTASACGLMLSEYGQLDIADFDDEELGFFKDRLFDVTHFINLNWPGNLQLQACPKTVAVHEPCSQRNALKNQQAVYDLLARIPAIDLIPLADNAVCCGAGGAHRLTHPHIAGPLGAEKIEQLHISGADLLVTSNIGCALHLAAGAGKLAPPVAVMHPVELLAGLIRTPWERCLYAL